MKRQKSCRPRLGKLVHQLLGVVNFSYDLHFRHMIAHWKDLSEEYNIFHKISHCNFATTTYPQKHRLGPQNGSRSSGPEKLLKIVNCQKCQNVVLSQLEKVGGHRYPSGSISKGWERCGRCKTGDEQRVSLSWEKWVVSYSVQMNVEEVFESWWKGQATFGKDGMNLW